MNEAYAILSGALGEKLSLHTLNAVLTGAGFETNAGNFAIRIVGFDEFVFRNLGRDLGEPIINASHSSASDLSDFAGLVSSALAGANIPHRFEIYDAADNLHSAFEHDWAG